MLSAESYLAAILLYTQDQGQCKKGLHAGRLEVRDVPGADWMVNEVYIQNMWIGHLVLLLFTCMIEAWKVEHSASHVVGFSWLLAAVFVSTLTEPRTSAHSKHGATF